MLRRIGPLTALLSLALISVVLVLFVPVNPNNANAATGDSVVLQRTALLPAAAHLPPRPDIAAGPVAPPGTTLHAVQRGQSLRSLAQLYLPQTSYMTTAELEAALYQANGWPPRHALRPGDTVIVPGFEGAIREMPVAVAADYEVRAIYLTGVMAGSARGLQLVQRWQVAGGNAVVFDLKDSDGIVNVPFEHRLSDGAPRPPIRNLPKLARWLHRQGMHVIGRIAIFRDERLVTRHPELAVRSRRTGQPWRENGKLVWTDPSRPEVQEFNIALARHAALQGVDEIQFDYVRFPAEGDQQDAAFYFDAHPLRRPPPPGQGKTLSAEPTRRSDVIADFLSKAYAELRPLKVLFSLDVFGVMAWQRPIDLAHTGQDIPAMAKFCDVLSPMIYPSHFFGMDGFKIPGDAPEHFISESMERFRQITAGSKVVLRPWLQAFGWKTPSYSPAYVETQVAVAKKNGGIGFLFWNARNDYSKPFAAMPRMRQDPKFFRGDGLPQPATPRKRAGAVETSGQPDANSG